MSTPAALTPKQRAVLKSLAHRLTPLLHIGKEGVTETVQRALEELLNNRELLKIKVHKEAPLEAREAGEALTRVADGAQVVQTIGRVIVLYRRHPQNPEIRLPS